MTTWKLMSFVVALFAVTLQADSNLLLKPDSAEMNQHALNVALAWSVINSRLDVAGFLLHTARTSTLPEDDIIIYKRKRHSAIT